MANRSGCLIALLCTLTLLNTVASARAAGDYFEVMDVTPSRVINHEIELKGPFDDDLIKTRLTGPQLFSHAVGSGEKAAQDRNAYLNWYKIAQPATEPRRILVICDSLRGNKAHQITIQNSAFLLLPAQRVTTGPPSPLPDGLDHFKAYKIVNATQVSQQVKLAGTYGPADRTATKAAYLCVPVEQRHHHDHFPVKNAQDCMLIYELMPHEHKTSVTTIDQFGLNKLDTHSGRWLSVPAEIVGPTSQDAK